PAREERVQRRWTQYSRGVPLIVLSAPYRSLVQPIEEYIEQLQRNEPNSLITLILPEFIPKGWWPKLLHGQAALMLNLRLRLKPGVVVIGVPYHIEAYVKLPKDYDPAKFQADERAVKNGQLPPIQEGLPTTKLQ